MPARQAGRDKCSFTVAFGEVFRQRAVVERLAAGMLEPRDVVRVLHAFQQLEVDPIL
jgi:hypothetical protein